MLKLYNCKPSEFLKAEVRLLSRVAAKCKISKDFTHLKWSVFCWVKTDVGWGNSALGCLVVYGP